MVLKALRTEKGKEREGLRPIIPEARKQLPCYFGGAAPKPLLPSTARKRAGVHGASPQTPLPFGIAQKEAKRLVFFMVLKALRTEKGKEREGLRPIIPEAKKT